MLPGVLVVLNEPRQGSKLTGGLSYAFRTPHLGAAGEVTEALFGPEPGAGLRPPAPARDAARPRRPTTTLERFWDECSYGVVQMKRRDSLVLGLTLPCGGLRANGATWSAGGGGAGGAGGGNGGAGGGGSCGDDELWGFMEYAVNHTTQVLGLDLSPYLRRVLLLPPATRAGSGAAAAASSTAGGGNGTSVSAGGGNGASAGGPLCRGWQQRGSLGCDGGRGCDIWIQEADPSRLLQAAITQLGASMGLRHAAAQEAAAEAGAGAEAGAASSSSGSWPPTDPSCPMGAQGPAAGFSCDGLYDDQDPDCNPAAAAAGGRRRNDL
ncbi:hypothetical protein GPECTOR_45g182 [Gonium pectorale]|uniref:Uncharacterized protein n=1 Tax=Gonium pectorale TaxID=33097 RepID=A0A150G8Z3_GONPE|nr:hypothetical protein GPECTOR_45g182 [Gonium pectorale]|eukprot:KXZ46312.1 hypothetical protein GPECTOR_45g182 [Gonium pectorale]